MNNLDVYNSVRHVPADALKEIQAGRLKGKSDINPMWRIKTLTEQFGVCGFGWKYKICSQRLETGGNNEISAFVHIELFVKINEEWSEAIPGTGGSSFVANEKNGLYTSDECFKMALTDAISVACKALGVGADVYWAKDSTKYTGNTEQEATNASKTENKPAVQNNPPEQKKEPENNPASAGQSSDIKNRATRIYFNYTGNKPGQWGRKKEEYKAWLESFKAEGKITTTFGLKWTIEDIEFLETEMTELPF